MIYCDDVFAILTRGPFPTGKAGDLQVEAHLTHCQDCQQLAEALRPALARYPEGVSDAESRKLPRYVGQRLRAKLDPAEYDALYERKDPAERHASRLGSSSVRSNLVRFGGALLFALVLVAACYGMRAIVPSPTKGPTNETASSRTILAGWDLPVACRSSTANRPQQDATLAPIKLGAETTNHCCTQCHSSAHQLSLSTTSTGRVARACHLCHDDGG
jgi:hypothetical protein